MGQHHSRGGARGGAMEEEGRFEAGYPCMGRSDAQTGGGAMPGRQCRGRSDGLWSCNKKARGGA